MDERDVAGVRLSRAVFMHFTAQEIRDLKDVFDFFDHKRRGFACLVLAIGFSVHRII
jgi:hypothetical protein